jgi:hypothetical protein
VATSPFLFDHLVGAGEQRRRHLEAKRLGRLKVDHKFEMAGDRVTRRTFGGAAIRPCVISFGVANARLSAAFSPDVRSERDKQCASTFSSPRRERNCAPWPAIRAAASSRRTRGFAAVGEPHVAVCLLPGTEIAFDENVECEPSFGVGILANKKIGQQLARFRQINMHNPVTHHDALEFPDGEVVLLSRLCEGQRATVLQLPAAARPEAAKERATPEVREPLLSS